MPRHRDWVERFVMGWDVPDEPPNYFLGLALMGVCLLVFPIELAQIIVDEWRS